MKKNSKVIFFYIALIAVFILASNFLIGQNKETNLVYSDIIQMFESEQVAEFKVKSDNTLSFKIKEDVAKYINNARIYITGQNLATITSYSGVDPETINMTGLEPGVEGVTYYPIPRTFMLGVNLTF